MHSRAIATSSIIILAADHWVRVHIENPLGIVPKGTYIVSKLNEDLVIYRCFSHVQRLDFPSRKTRHELDVSAQENRILKE